MSEMGFHLDVGKVPETLSRHGALEVVKAPNDQHLQRPVPLRSHPVSAEVPS